MPFYPFLGERSPAKIDDRKRGTLILTFLLDLHEANHRLRLTWVGLGDLHGQPLDAGLPTLC